MLVRQQTRRSSSRVSRVGAAAGLLRGLRGGARGGAEAPRRSGAGYARTHRPSGGPLDALRRRGTRLRPAAARHGVGLVAVDGGIAATCGKCKYLLGASAARNATGPAAGHLPLPAARYYSVAHWVDH